MSFAEKIYLIRTHANLTQDEMADLFEVSRQTISKWESGLSYPKVEKLIDISEHFDISIDYLLKDETSGEKINQKDLGTAVFQFLGTSQDMNQICNSLIHIMKDGVIDDIEKQQLENHTYELEQIVETIRNLQNMLST